MRADEMRAQDLIRRFSDQHFEPVGGLGRLACSEPVGGLLALHAELQTLPSRLILTQPHRRDRRARPAAWMTRSASTVTLARPEDACTRKPLDIFSTASTFVRVRTSMFMVRNFSISQPTRSASK